MRYWHPKLKLVWSFAKMLNRADEISIECQKVEQAMHDKAFENDLSYKQKENDLYYLRGVTAGLKRALEIANG